MEESEVNHNSNNSVVPQDAKMEEDGTKTTITSEATAATATATATAVNSNHNNHTNSNHNDSDVKWSNLTGWITQNGGVVHTALHLNAVAVNNRGVFARTPIAAGEVLFRIPESCAIDGRSMPERYRKDKRQASPWLRCVAAFYQYTNRAQQQQTSGATSSSSGLEASYRDILPTHYETLWQWSEEEIECYLAGTTCPGGGGWNADSNLIEERYLQQVRPYLESINISLSDFEYEYFAMVCQAMSTRCFHLDNKAARFDDDDDDDDNNNYHENYEDAPTTDDYFGPFFIPAIDMLNHSSQPELISTALHRSDGAFLMVAERDIAAGEEILHSYGTHLTAGQFLHTFGFVPLPARKTSSSSSQPDDSATTTNGGWSVIATPAVLEKQAVLDACYDVIHSKYPEKLAASMQEHELEDEVWAMPTDEERCAAFLPDVLVVDSTDPLPNELITCACLPFLPICAYREAARSLLQRGILEDYFLGKLVCASILKALDNKLATYTPIIYQGTVRDDDAQLLQELLLQDHKDQTTMRLVYGLIVRLGEKQSLNATRQEVMSILASLDVNAELEASSSNNMVMDQPSPPQPI